MDELRLALSFFTRLPLRPLAALPDGAMARATRYFPVAGAVIGLLAATVYMIGHWLFPSAVAALLAVSVTALFTGGLHEDGLADMVDGFGGGRDRDAKLAIMKDSRIGSYGVLAILLSVLLRIGALSALGSATRVGAALIALHSLSRAILPFALAGLPSARPNGLGASIGRPSVTDLGIAATFAICIAGILLPSAAALAAILGAILGAGAIAWLALRQIGGQTGDVLGAAQQVAETLGLLFVAAAMPHLS